MARKSPPTAVEPASAQGILAVAADQGALDDLMDTFIEVSSGGSGETIILINDVKNQTVQEIIEENIKHSAELFEDSDGNDSLDSEEEDNPLASGTSVP